VNPSVNPRVRPADVGISAERIRRRCVVQDDTVLRACHVLDHRLSQVVCTCRPVYIARPAAVLTEFLDLDRVEVLRGPQRTLYGHDAVEGALNLTTKVPTDNV
jgi:hypothetical protein